MEILILGTGCYNCLKLEVMMARLLQESGLTIAFQIIELFPFKK
jgi:hypothetical protein